MTRISKIFIIVLALVMLAACNNGGTGGGGSVEEAGVAEGTSGTRTIDCLRITYTAQGDEVMVRLYLNGQLTNYVFLSPQVIQQSVDYSYGNYSLSGLLIFSPGTPIASSLLETSGITIGCNGQTTNFSGIIFSW